MPLPDNDTAYLQDRDFPHEITEESGMTCVVFPKFKLPAGLYHESAYLLVRLPAVYPNLPPAIR